MAGCSGGGSVAAELCRVRRVLPPNCRVSEAVRRMLPPNCRVSEAGVAAAAASAWLRHKYIGVNSGSLVGLVSKTNIFLY